MSRLDALRKNIIDMTPEERRELVLRLRVDRMIRREPKPSKPKKGKAAAKPRIKKKTKAEAALDQLSLDDIAAIVKKYGGEDGPE